MKTKRLVVLLSRTTQSRNVFLFIKLISVETVEALVLHLGNAKLRKFEFRRLISTFALLRNSPNDGLA
jgi:hypothetical protein